MPKDNDASINRILTEGRIHFARFKDKSFLSLEPKGDNKIYILCWSSMTGAVAHCTMAKIPEDVGIVSIDLMIMPDEMANWPDDQFLMLDRQTDGSAKIIDIRSIKDGKFIFTDYQGEPPDVQPVPINPELIIL